MRTSLPLKHLAPALFAACLACGAGGAQERSSAVGPSRPAAPPEQAAPVGPVAPPPPAVEAVSLARLLEVARLGSGDEVVTALGGHRLSVRCTPEAWQPEANGQIESQSCPAGRVAMGELMADIEVRIARRIDDPSVSRADIVLTAQTDANEAWLVEVRRVLDAQLDEVTGLQNDRSRTTYDLAGGVRATIRDPGTGAPPVLLLFRPSRSTSR